MATFLQPHARFNFAQSGQQLQLWIDMLAACGWEQTSHPGQATPETAPTTLNTNFWCLFRSTDTLTAQLPIYLRVSFFNQGHGSYSGCYVRFVEVGFEVDGEGSLPNSSMLIAQPTVSTSQPSATNPVYLGAMIASGDGGSLRVCDYPGYFAYSTSAPERGVHAISFFALSRTKDADGNPTADGVVALSPAMYILADSVKLTSSTLTPAGLTVNRSPNLCPILLETVNQPGQVATVGGMPQMQHPWACTPRLYPFEDIGMFPSYQAAAIGDILNVQQGGGSRKYIFLGRTGPCPSTVGYSGTASTSSTADMYLEAGYAMLWE